MKKKKDTPFHNPFGQLKLQPKPPPAAPVSKPSPKSSKTPPVDQEAALFLEAVGQVDPVRAPKNRVGPPAPPTAAELKLGDEAESLARLAELVSAEGDFETTDTTDFLEAWVRGFDSGVMRKLRRGDFRVEAKLDLHGMNRDAAQKAVETFIAQARVAGHRCVLVVTGRGLHSPDQMSVLKEGIVGWLTRGRMARQLLGFCSAKPKDGGLGALYVLLRR